jgi:hypothetical protein
LHGFLGFPGGVPDAAELSGNHWRTGGASSREPHDHQRHNRPSHRFSAHHNPLSLTLDVESNFLSKWTTELERAYRVKRWMSRVSVGLSGGWLDGSVKVKRGFWEPMAFPSF